MHSLGFRIERIRPTRGVLEGAIQCREGSSDWDATSIRLTHSKVLDASRKRPDN